MAVYIHRVREVALNIEGTKGTFSAPDSTGTDSKLLIQNAKLAFETEAHERPIMASDLSRYPDLIGKIPVKLSFDIEGRASAAAGTADKWGDLFKICGFKVTNTPATSDVYKPSSLHSTHSCGSFYVYLGSAGTTSLRISVSGAMGNVRCVSEVGKPTMWSFDISGVYEAVSTSGTVNTVSHESAVPPVFLAPSFTYNSVSAKISRFSWDMGNQVVQREDANDSAGIAHFAIVDRRPTFEMDPEWEATGTISWLGLKLAGTEVAVAYNIGSKLAVAIPKAQITSVDDGERNGLSIADCKGNMNRSSGDDEISITKT